jgi:FAD dependent oxidoreductase TIGR03364
LHLAHADDEQQVLAEIAAAAPDWGVDCELLDARQVLERTPAARPEQLRGGLWSPVEVCVNPRQALAQIPPWLHARHGVEFQYQTPVRRVEPGRLETAAGATWEFDRILVASGHDFVTLFPAVFAAAGVRTCKLQMLRTEPQPEGWRIGPVLATGLTLRHYETFRHCPTLEPLRQRIARETPHMDAYGIHVLLSQHAAGEVLLGDSHEYDERATPFRNELIDELILQEVDRCVRLPRLRIAERWQGYYAKLPGVTEFVHEPCPGVAIVLASGGAGMTMSLGYAERRWP